MTMRTPGTIVTQAKLDELAADCDRLALEMRSVGAKMEAWSVSDDMSVHATELLGAADIARSWAKRLRVGKVYDVKDTP